MLDGPNREFRSFSAGAQKESGYVLVLLVTWRGQTVTQGSACHTVLHLCMNSGPPNSTPAICSVQMLLCASAQSLIGLNLLFVALLCTCTYINLCVYWSFFVIFTRILHLSSWLK